MSVLKFANQVFARCLVLPLCSLRATALLIALPVHCALRCLNLLKHPAARAAWRRPPVISTEGGEIKARSLYAHFLDVLDRFGLRVFI